MGTNIIKINTNKLQISLMDGSVWMLVNVGDITKISIWYPPQRVEVEDDNGEYVLTNLDTYGPEKVRVARIA
jgi:hypothetical protein